MTGMRDFVIDQMFGRMDEGMSEREALENILDIAQTGLQLVRTEKMSKRYQSLIECAEELYTEYECLGDKYDQEDYTEALANGFYRTRYTK